MATYEITAEMNLEKIISEAREVAQAVNDFADSLERIQKKYEDAERRKDEHTKTTDTTTDAEDEG